MEDKLENWKKTYKYRDMVIKNEVDNLYKQAAEGETEVYCDFHWRVNAHAFFDVIRQMGYCRLDSSSRSTLPCKFPEELEKFLASYPRSSFTHEYTFRKHYRILPWFPASSFSRVFKLTHPIQVCIYRVEKYSS